MLKKIYLFSVSTFFALISLGLLAVTTPAFATLHLELTQGVNTAIPIAIVPFANEQPNLPGEQTLTRVLKNDLQNSGQFRVQKRNVLSQNPTTVEQIDFANWRKQKVNDVIVGQIDALGGNQYRVSFELVGLYAKSLAVIKAHPQQAILAEGAFTVSRTGLRRLAHHISDIIYKKLTGIRGVFSTKVAYVLVKRALRKPPVYTLEVSDADGFNPRPLLVSHQPIMSPSWAPNGQKLAYVSFEGRHSAVFLQDVVTGQRTLLSRFPGINGAPAFSPNGKALALVLTQGTGNPKIYVYDLTRKKLTKITKGYAIDTEPAWSPEGRSLLFTSNRGGAPQIYRYNFKSQRVSRMTFNGNYNARGSFFPNGKAIVMMHRGIGLFGIAQQNLVSGQVKILAQTGNDESPSIAPNGKMILYATQYGGRGVLAVVSSDGRIKLRLPARDGNVQEPAWSPYL